MRVGIGVGLTSRRRAGGSAPVVTNWYVDSVSGSDSNSGLSPSAALQTIAALSAKPVQPGHALNFKCGSYWREQYVLQATSLTLQTYGSGAAPVFDGADVATGWVNVGGATPNVWSKAWTRPTTTSATEYLGLWADGVRPRFATSLSDLQTNGGWYTANRAAQNGTVYIKSATDPNSSGVVYEITKRQFCIEGHEANTTVLRTSTTTGPFELKRAYGHYNAFTGSLGSASALLIRDGTIHHDVTEGNLRDVCVPPEFIENYPTTFIPSTFFKDVGAGYSAMGQRLFLSGNATSAQTSGGYGQAVLMHNSTSGWDSVTLEQVWVKLFNLGWSAGAPGITALIARGCFSDTLGSLGDQMASTTSSATITHYLGRTSTLSDGGPEDGTARTRTIQHAAIYNAAGAGPVSVGPRTGSLTISNCVLVVGSNSPSSAIGATPYTGPSLPAAGIQVTINNCVVVFLGTVPNPSPIAVTRGVGGSYTGNNNLFVYPNGSAGQVRFQLDGTNYDGLAAWQAASGQDANSRVLAADVALLSKLFVNGANGLFCGDFRMKTGAYTLPGGQDVATTCGPQQRWDWNGRQAVSGANQRWPVCPATLTDQRTYIAAPASWEFYPARTTAPTAGSITGTATNDSQYTVTFSAGSASDAVAGAYSPDAYLVEDGSVVAGPISSPYTRTGRTNGQTYSVQVRYQDVAGNAADTAATNVTPAVPLVNPLLDDFGGATAAFSTRLLRAGWASGGGKCLRVRRSSDSTEQDIGFTSGSNATLDTAALLAFVGSGDGFVRTWYDQTGNAHHAQQASAGLQQKIVASGVVQVAGTRPVVMGDGGAGHNMQTDALGLAQPFTMFSRVKNTRTTNAGQEAATVYTAGGAATNALQFYNQTGTTCSIQVDSGSFTSFTGQPQDAINSLLVSGSSSKYAANANAPATCNPGTTNADGFVRIFNPWLGPVGEIVFYASDQTTNRAGIRDNMNAWWGVY